MKSVIAAALSLAFLASCGPAPGYGPDGRMLPQGTESAPPYRGDRSGPPPQGGYAPPNQPPPNGYGYGYGYGTPTGAPNPPASYPEDSSGGYSGSGAEPIAPDPGGEPAADLPAVACDDSCRFANNGECDDGREGSDTDLCNAGADCTDCGSAPR